MLGFSVGKEKLGILPLLLPSEDKLKAVRGRI